MIFDILKNNVCKIICGGVEGTGFLINNKLVLTAFHVIKKYNDSSIELFFEKGDFLANLHKSIDTKYKKMDIAILELNNEVDFYSLIEFEERELSVGASWISRGYPSIIGKEGTNLYNRNYNRINSSYRKLKNNKFDLALDISKTFNSYEGLSGAPLIIDKKIVGIINTELREQGIVKQLYGLSFKYFKDLIAQLKEKKGKKNMINNYGLSFLVNRFDIRHEMNQFIKPSSKVNKKIFLIRYNDDWDDPLDIILWLKKDYIKLGYYFIKFDLSEKNNIDSLEDKLLPAIKNFRKNNKNQFKEFYSKIIKKNRSNTNVIIEKMSTFFRGILKDKKTTLEILKDDFKEFNNTIAVILVINSKIKYNAEKLYYEIEEALKVDKVKLIIITNNMYDFKETDMDIYKTITLNTIRKDKIKKYLNTTIKTYLNNINIKQSEIDAFLQQLDKEASHNEIKNEIIKYFNLSSSPIEGEKNAI